MALVDYPVAKGHMANVWATLECPVCGDEMRDVHYEQEEDASVDTYACDYCNLLVSYVAPAWIGEYHAVPDNQRAYHIERQF